MMARYSHIHMEAKRKAVDTLSGTDFEPDVAQKSGTICQQVGLQPVQHVTHGPGSLTVEEAAKVLGVSSKTVKREWSMAKARLCGELEKRHGHDARTLGKNKGAV